MTRASKAPSIMEAKAILNLKDLADDKHAWKQWDLKFGNAFDNIQIQSPKSFLAQTFGIK